MRLLFDNGVPSTLRHFLTLHEVDFARDRGWAEYVIGKLITAAAKAGFEAIVTCDKNWRHQQNLAKRPLSSTVLQSGRQL